MAVIPCSKRLALLTLTSSGVQLRKVHACIIGRVIHIAVNGCPCLSVYTLCILPTFTFLTIHLPLMQGIDIEAFRRALMGHINTQRTRVSSSGTTASGAAARPSPQPGMNTDAPDGADRDGIGSGKLAQRMTGQQAARALDSAEQFRGRSGQFN